MPEQRPATETVTVADVKSRFDSLVDRVSREGTRVLVERNGVPVAAIVSSEDLERLRRLDEERARDFALLDELAAPFVGVPAEEIEREGAKALAEVRAEMRAERARNRADAVAR